MIGPRIVRATGHIKRMSGGSQSHLMRCSDGHQYIVKFKNNPQGSRVLVNEMFGASLARLAGLPVPQTAVVDVSGSLIQATPDLTLQLEHGSIPCASGLQFGSRSVNDFPQAEVISDPSNLRWDRVRNRRSFAGILALDKWTCNNDGRQAMFWRGAANKTFAVTFIDNGYCFNAGLWDLLDSPCRGIYPDNRAYYAVRGWQSFEPWLSTIEGMEDEAIWNAAGDVPPEWYRSEWARLEDLIISLLERRSVVRRLISEFRGSSRQPFPQWV